jgi:uncharacterized protein YukE
VAKDWRTLKLEVLAETTQFVKGMDKANATTQSFGDKVGDFAKKAGIALAAVGAAAGAMAIKIGKEAVAAASDLAETVSKVNVIFGQSAKNIEQFAASAAASLGQTRTQAMNAAATFGIFGKSAGLAGQELTAFSTEFVTLASDLASFNNTSVDQAITALGAALRGESEPIRSYGVLLNDATLKAKAMEMGIYSGTGTLNAQQKVLAAHKVILEQTKDAQGDFARTADGMANSQRVLTARLEEAKIVLGQALLPIALDVVNLFNDRFLPVIEKLAGSFGGANGLIQQTQTFINQAREALAPILEALQRAFDRISEAMEHNKDDIKAVTDLFVTMANFFEKYIIPIIKYQLVQAIEGIGIAFSVVLKIIGPVVSVISSAIDGLLKLVDGAISRINSLIEAYNRISFLPNLPTIKSGTANPIAPNIQLPFGGASVGGATGAGVAGGVNVGGGITVGGASASALSKGILSAIKPQQTLIEQISEEQWLKKTIESGVFDVAKVRRGDENGAIKAIPSNFNIAAARAGEERGNVVINVNAPSAIDEEGFTRAVILALNQTQARTGGGGSQLVL